MSPQQQKGLEGVFLALVGQLKEQGFSDEQLRNLLDNRGECIPATAFATKLTPLETLTRYLESNPECHRLLGRSKAAIDAVRRNSYSKYSKPLPSKETQYKIPVTIFADGRHSALEHVCLYLRDHYHLRNKEIAALIGRDQRVIATVLSRGEPQ